MSITSLDRVARRGVLGCLDRSFILGDRSSDKRICDRQACRKRSRSVPEAYRSVSNHPIGMVEMDKIVSEKRGWVYLR